MSPGPAARELTRRGLAVRLGAGAVAVAGGVLALPDPPSSPTSTTDGEVAARPGGSTDAAPQLAEADTPYAVWQYRRRDGQFEPTAPINVVCPLDAATFDEVVDVFRQAGWHAFPAEYARYAWDRERETYVLQHWSAAESYFGTVGRHHVRCWHTDGTASIQAHVDSAALPSHAIRSYALGQAGVAALFADAGWQVDDDRLAFGNDSEPDHDGEVTVVRAAGGA